MQTHILAHTELDFSPAAFERRIQSGFVFQSHETSSVPDQYCLLQDILNDEAYRPVCGGVDPPIYERLGKRTSLYI